MTYKLRDYQEKISKEISLKIKYLGVCYFQGEVRTGKTATSLKTCELLKVKNVLFITKKKAISSIESDYNNFNFSESFNLTVINYESLHKIIDIFDFVICDESHSFASYPKPSKIAKLIKERYSKIPILFLTGTSSVESGSQWYHQFWVSNASPFNKYKNFYQWAKDYVDVLEINYGNGYPSKNYSKANREKITKKIYPYLVTFSQEDAGFSTKIIENFLKVEMLPITYKMCDKLIKDRFIQGTNDKIIADTPVKLMSKLHQLYNGSCITEDNKTIITDKSKAIFIKDYFKDKKIAIFYYFKAELDILKSIFGDNLTLSVDDFNRNDKNIAIQQNGTEGLNLSNADCLIYYNFGFSGKNMIQSRDRLTTKDRLSNDIYYIFEKDGISSKIFKKVSKKQNYNKKNFLIDYEKNRRNKKALGE